MAKKRSNAKSSRQHYNDEFQSFLSKNPVPIQIPTDFNRSQKTFSVHDLKNIQPMTRNQERFFEEWNNGYNIANLGTAGSGKTFLAIYAALSQILDKDTPYEKLIIIRSLVGIRDPGALPGDLDMKTSVVESPYSPIFDDLFKKTNQYKYMKESGMVEFLTTSFIRGTTFKNAIVIFDECQNANIEELSTVVTRCSDTTRIIFCGDTRQNDLIRKKTDVSGLEKFSRIINMMPSMRTIHYTLEDICRGGIVKEYLYAQHRYEEQYE